MDTMEVRPDIDTVADVTAAASTSRPRSQLQPSSFKTPFRKEPPRHSNVEISAGHPYNIETLPKLMITGGETG
jgi:hypothetical protein